MSTRFGGASLPRVALGVTLALAVAGAPFVSKRVREREAAVAALRDEVYDAKGAARSARLSTRAAAGK